MKLLSHHEKTFVAKLKEKKKRTLTYELILHTETVPKEWNVKFGLIFIHVCHEGKAFSGSDSIGIISLESFSSICIILHIIPYWNLILQVLISRFSRMQNKKQKKNAKIKTPVTKKKSSRKFKILK